MVMKSYWPRVAHWSFTVTPSCSTSLLTSLTRLGLFFSVCTPSEVRLVSITYVGIASPLLGWAPFLSFSGAACNPGIREDHPIVPDHPLFARFYDRLTARTERGGLGDLRRELLSSASGRVLELGAGTGHNLEHYTDAVTELVLAEPDPNMAQRLRERLTEDGTAAATPSVIGAPAEELPFDDGSFDVVVATLVLCTVDDPARALREVRR